MELLIDPVQRDTAIGRANVFEDLYKTAFPPFARYVSKMNASLDDAKDVFHDALIVYYEKSLDATFEIQTSPEAYVLGVARNLWFRKFQRLHRESRLENAPEGFSLPEDFVETPAERTLLKFLERSGEKCLELLNKFYYESSSLREIASWLGYKTEHSAAVQKYKCLSKIRNEVKRLDLRHEDFHI